MIVGIALKDDSVLMRKKPEGSPPYKETWYIFGGELLYGVDPQQTIVDAIKYQSGVTVSVDRAFSWGTEVKNDVDGIEKQFVYLDVTCTYESGALEAAPGIEKLEWVPISQLKEYDLVPPSVEVFRKLG